MQNVTFSDGSRLSVTFTPDKDQAYVNLTELTTGIERVRIPLLTLEIYSKAEFRAEMVGNYKVESAVRTTDGLHVVIHEPTRGIRLGLGLSIVEGELRVSLPMEEVVESLYATYRLFSVILFPGLMTAGPHGHLLLPLNTGVITTPEGKPKLADRFMIYGEQTRWELLPMLPVCAVINPRGGWMAIATEGACETECHVSTDGAGNGEIGFAFSLRQFWPDPVEHTPRGVRYIPIASGADLLHTVARRLRRHIMEDLGKPTLRQRAQESPEVAALLKSYIMKLFYAVQTQGIMMQGQSTRGEVTFKQVMNFAEAKAGLQALHTAGIGHIITQSVGWNPRGHDGLWPTRFPIEERLGGEAGFRDLIETGTSLGYQMNVHDNHLSAYRASPDFDVSRVIHDQWGEPMGLGEWGGGVTFILNALALPGEWIEGQMLKVKGLGLTGAGYLDGMGNPLYRDYHPAHRMTRTGYAKGVNRLIETARSVYGAAGTECGFLYCVIPSDSMVTGGADWHFKACWPSWPIYPLLEKRVPLWQLALHGLIVLENHGIHWPGIMECILFGNHPRDEWSAHPGVMPVLDEPRIRALKVGYDLCLERYGHLQTETLTHYEEPAAGVRRTTFENGTEVIADFNTLELVVDGERLARPKDV